MLPLLLLLLGQNPPGDNQADVFAIPKDFLVIAAEARGGRTPVRTDPVEALLVKGAWKSPKEGETLGEGSRNKWEKVPAGPNGTIRHPSLAGGYALWNVDSDTIQTMVLEAQGHGMVYVNGEPRPGDPYGYGYLALPVGLKKGVNEILFFGGRGTIQAKLRKAKGPVEVGAGDATLPDLVAQTETKQVGAVVIRNCTDKIMSGLVFKASVGDETRTSTVPSIPGHSLFKSPFQFAHKSLPEGKTPLIWSLCRGEKILAKGEFTLEIKSPKATRKVTFISGIDKSTQYYGLVPALPSQPDSLERPGIVLTLHGASVEGIGQAASYAPKTWAHIIAPTNRRPFGFDWEDWGRMDALEILDHAQKEYKTDPRKTWLTGHSMGGHGTWHLGVTFADRFGAIGPSAGWISMFSYAGARRPEAKTPMAKMLSRATNLSDTLGLVQNLKTKGTYILHGDQDDNVPVTQARAMRAKLGEFHPDFTYYERPGAGHWWGAECVDWPAMMRFLSERPIADPKNITEVDFRTFHAGISSTMGFATIEAQELWGELSEIQIKADINKGMIQGASRNVRKLTLNNPGWTRKEPWNLTLDGQSIELKEFAQTGKATIEWKDKKWKTVGPQDPTTIPKKPGLAGPIKEGFRGKMAYVVGTSGTPEETKANWSKARYDAEIFYYRGNGAIEIYTDTEWEKSPEGFKGRNLILLGNRDNNKAIKKLLAESPIQVESGQIEWPGGKPVEGNDKATIYIQPRRDDPGYSIVCLGATGPAGMRLLERLSLWVSGSSFPDYLIVEPSTLKDGIGGFIAAGYFGANWDWDPAQAAIR